MSRSRRLPFIKDNGNYSSSEYWRTIRREWKQKLKANYYKEDFYLRNPKTIIDSYDICDYKFDYLYNRVGVICLKKVKYGFVDLDMLCSEKHSWK